MPFLEFSCFCYDPTGVGNLISGSSTVPKSSLHLWKFLVHVLLKISLEEFEHYFANYFASSLNILWHCLSLGLKWKLTFSSPLPLMSFQICWHIECSTFTESSFRIWNSSTGISSPPPALFIVMLPKAHLISHSRLSVFRWVITP